MIFRIAYNGNTPSIGTHNLTLGDALLCVVSSLCVYVGLEDTQEVLYVRFTEEDHVVNTLQGRQ